MVELTDTTESPAHPVVDGLDTRRPSGRDLAFSDDVRTLATLGLVPHEPRGRAPALLLIDGSTGKRVPLGLALAFGFVDGRRGGATLSVAQGIKAIEGFRHRSVIACCVFGSSDARTRARSGDAHLPCTGNGARCRQIPTSSSGIVINAVHNANKTDTLEFADRMALIFAHDGLILVDADQTHGVRTDAGIDINELNDRPVRYDAGLFVVVELETSTGRFVFRLRR